MSQIRSEYLFRDTPYAPGQLLPDYDTLEYDCGGEHIYGQIMWPGGDFDRPRPCVIFLHGFPGSARNDDIAHALCRTGCVVLTPHMRGAWGSQGKYLVSQCVSDAAALASWVQSEDFVRKYNIDTEAIFFIGHSMGGCVALNAAKQLSWLRGVALMAPFDPARLLPVNPTRTRELLQAGHILHSDGLEAIYEDLADHWQELAFANALETLRETNILLLAAQYDSVAPPEIMVRPFWKALTERPSSAIRRLRSYPVEHGLLGCRVGLTEEIAQFIADCLYEK